MSLVEQKKDCFLVQPVASVGCLPNGADSRRGDYQLAATRQSNMAEQYGRAIWQCDMAIWEDRDMYDIDEGLRKRRPAHSLPGEFYHDTEIYRSDLSRIWYRQWIFVAHTAEVSAPGDYLTVSIGEYRILVIRDNKGEVGVLHNVCRHRGSIICTEASGSVKQRLTCPYHQWSYSLDGTFARGRSTPEDLILLHTG
jgi:nitrite reductase/ring-hydroxylating ferredoxin subunit